MKHAWRVWRAGQLGYLLGEPKVPLDLWMLCGATGLDRLKFGSSGHPEFAFAPSVR